MAEIINESNFEEKVLKNKKIVIVDFFANWCGPCNDMINIVDKFEEKHEELSVYRVDVDKNIKLAEKYNVLSVPTFVIFKDGEIFDSFLGKMEKDKFEKTVENILK